MLFSYLRPVHIWIVSSKLRPQDTFACPSFCLRASRATKIQAKHLPWEKKNIKVQSQSSVTLSGEMLKVNYFVWTNIHKMKNEELKKKEVICSKQITVYCSLSLSLLAYSLCTSGLMPQDPIGDMSRVSLEQREQRRRLLQDAPCAPPISQTLVITFPRRVSQRQLCKPFSNYCCGPVIALPKSCILNSSCIHGRRQKHNKKHFWLFFLS